MAEDDVDEMTVDAERAWLQDRSLLAVFVANQLGPKPRLRVDQDAAIARASVALELSDTLEAASGRRMLAIEYTAETNRKRGRPADWAAAIALVDGLTDDEVRLRARGGMVFRAARAGWAKRPS